MSDPIRVVDAHIHLWDLSTGLYPHFEEPSDSFIGNTAEIARSYLLPELLAEGGAEVVLEKAVHVEAFPTDRVEETRVLQSLADGAGEGKPQALVVNVDLAADDAEAQIIDQKRFANTRGIRQVLNLHEIADFSYGAPDHLANPVWMENFDLLRSHDLSFDLQIYPHQMAGCAALAAQNPDVGIVLNHAGMFVDRTPDGWKVWKDGLRTMAAQPNITVKIGGLGMFDHNWTVESFRPYIYEVLEAFGPERSMLASNFPVDKLFATYVQHWQAFAEIIAPLSENEQALLLRETAERVYRI